MNINKVLLITSKNFKEPAVKNVVKILKNKGIEYIFLSERWLSDNMVTSIASYLYRIRCWNKFNKVIKYV